MSDKSLAEEPLSDFVWLDGLWFVTCLPTLGPKYGKVLGLTGSMCRSKRKPQVARSIFLKPLVSFCLTNSF